MAENYNEESILIAINEFEMWNRKFEAQKAKVKAASGAQKEEEQTELARIKQHVLYYEQLIRDMKRQYSPPSITNVMK